MVVLGGVSNQAFALRIHGDSMKPEFSVGEVIIVDHEVEATRIEETYDLLAKGW